MARGDFPSTKQDQFNLRFPEGMRDEIQRLAAEDGRSMNAQIIELLNFAIKNSGLDIDEIMQMLASQRKEMADLRKQIGAVAPIESTDGVQQQLEEYRRALKQKDGLLMAVCLQLFVNREQLPAESLVLADALLNSFDEIDLLTLNDEEISAVPTARYDALIRRFMVKNRSLKAEQSQGARGQNDQPEPAYQYSLEPTIKSLERAINASREILHIEQAKAARAEHRQDDGRDQDDQAALENQRRLEQTVVNLERALEAAREVLHSESARAEKSKPKSA